MEKSELKGKVKYHFSGKLWKDNLGGWCFVTLPLAMSKEIRKNFQWQEEGWGRMKAVALVNEIRWNTSIWFDKKKNRYLLPMKADIRKSAHLKPDDTVNVDLFI
ncbi:MAG: DUF1905 domain-containing protein [Bacteroidota bacterium]